VSLSSTLSLSISLSLSSCPVIHPAPIAQARQGKERKGKERQGKEKPGPTFLFQIRRLLTSGLVPYSTGFTRWSLLYPDLTLNLESLVRAGRMMVPWIDPGELT
jgi:hypothetical protein